MTLAPLSAAKRIASAMPATEPEPEPDSTLSGMIFTLRATPATPFPLLVICAIVPVTWVPWPWSSLALRVFETKS